MRIAARNHLRRLILLGVLVLLLPACGAGRDPPPSSTAVPATEVTEFTAQSGDVQLFIRLATRPGSDCLLIAINGGPGLSSDYMRDLEQLAGQGCNVATYDQRGTGRSSRPAAASASSYTLDLYTADLAAVHDALVARSESPEPAVHLFGHSFGAIVAMHYATRYSENVASLIFYGGGPPTAEAMGQAQAGLGRRVDQLIASGRMAPPEEWAGQGIEPLLPAYFSDPAFTFAEDGAGQAPSYDDQVNALTYVNLEALDLRPELAGLAAPVLLLFGRDDPFGLAMAEASRDALTSAEVTFAIIDDCGHFWHECPAAFYARLIDFLGLTT